MKEMNEGVCGSNTIGQHSKQSVSSKKLLAKSDAMESKPCKVEEPHEEVTITSFRFVNMQLLSTTFSPLRCADCGEFSIVLLENHLERKRCVSSLESFARIVAGNMSFGRLKSRL